MELNGQISAYPGCPVVRKGVCFACTEHREYCHWIDRSEQALPRSPWVAEDIAGASHPAMGLNWALSLQYGVRSERVHEVLQDMEGRVRYCQNS